MPSHATLVEAIRAVAPPGMARLDDSTLRMLRELTADLIAVRTSEALAEEARFLSIADRTLCLPETQLDTRLAGATVLVTGGTGCIGSALLGQLTARETGPLISVSRGVTTGWPLHPQVSYQRADVMDAASIGAAIDRVRPDVIFHVAGQRDPGLAEAELLRTLGTNVVGTRNVFSAAVAAGTTQVVLASTGKALRLYSSDTYAASKRAAEWIAADAASSTDLLCSAARFTHVIDNSIIYRKLRNWASTAGVVRLHSPDTGFYVQSALESARLLLLACATARPGELTIHAITDLGWPVSLLDLALGVLARSGSSAPLYFSGYDPGYEAESFPALYDPLTSGDVSPLINALEAAAAVSTPCHMCDAFAMPGAPGLGKLFGDFAAEPSRASLEDLSWSLLDLTLLNAPRTALARAAKLAGTRCQGRDHQRILDAIRAYDA
jgi:nucleoside-diphosphate-sugar epimerase